MKTAFAEVVESSLNTWQGHCWQWDDFPQFGSLVTIMTPERTLFGIVSQIQTGSLDPLRTPFPFGKTEEELLKEQPQIFAFLKTTFICTVVGYEEHNTLVYQWPSEPPKIHAFIHRACDEQYKRFFSGEQYIHLLFGSAASLPSLDELLLALLHQRARRNLLSQEKLTQFVELFSLLTGNDYRRLKLFLQRVSATLTPGK